VDPLKFGERSRRLTGALPIPSQARPAHGREGV